MLLTYLRKTSFVKATLLSGLLIGMADGVAAVSTNFLMKHVSADRVFKFVASGVFGMKAFAGSNEMVVAGLIFHFLIALTFTSFFFIIANFYKSLLTNVLLIGGAYGLGVWLIMNFLVIPLSNTPSIPFQADTVVVGIVVHVFVIGVPIAWLAKQHLSAERLST
ncbi:MAG: hypothetical protein O9262_07445 [Cyclobacteriaceae bacterium]|nr:hypothetical protein [Cyclobacteriaceae bacterium]